LGNPETTSEGIHDTLVADDSIRIATPLPHQARRGQLSATASYQHYVGPRTAGAGRG
jgi:hypothetical protein